MKRISLYLLAIIFFIGPVCILFNTGNVYANNNLTDKRVKVSSGFNHNIVLDSDGTAWVWGENANGQLGDGTSINKSTPTKLDKLSGLIDISAGGNCTLVLKDDGSVWGCGLNNFGQLGIGTNSKSISTQWLRWGNEFSDAIWITAGEKNTAVVKSDGTLWVCGDNTYGQLGNEDINTIFRETPRQVNELTNVIAASAGTRHMIALKKDGTVWAWGNYDDKEITRYGSVGPDGILRESTNTSHFKNKPVHMEGLTDVIAVSAGAYHSVALKKDGTVWTWGRNSSGQLGTGMYETEVRPYKVSDVTDITAISAGSYGTVALKKDGTVLAWGNIGGGQTWSEKPKPIKVNVLTDIIDITAGERQALALKKDGTIWTWSTKGMGNFGLVSTYQTTTPTIINEITLTIPTPKPVEQPEPAKPATTPEPLPQPKEEPKSETEPVQVKVKVDNTLIKFKYDPIIVGKDVTVQADMYSKTLGAIYKWDIKTKTIKITKGKVAIAFKIDSKTATVNGKSYKLTTPAKLYKATFIPAQFVAEKLGFKYTYNEKTKMAVISKK